MVEGRERAVEAVEVEAEAVKAVQSVEREREGGGEHVVGEIEGLEAVEGGDGGRNGAGEVVVGEEESFEIDEAGEVGDGAGERVVLEAEDSELGEATQRVGRENAAEIEVLEDESSGSGIGTLDSLPFAESQGGFG